AYPPLTMHEPAQDPLGQAERDALLAVLDARQWHVSRAAQQLGISRNTLYRKLRKYGITRS
ncbi:MAG: helix-turn-helix domain-containing protein, partial [Pseudomonadales bacterium]